MNGQTNMAKVTGAYMQLFLRYTPIKKLRPSLIIAFTSYEDDTVARTANLTKDS
jgi:hypothetical protein